MNIFAVWSLLETWQDFRCHILQGLSHLRTLQAIMDEVYRLFDRRCRTDTTLAELTRLCQRVQRFTYIGKTRQCVFCAHVEKAPTVLDDRLLLTTTNAVERANRRHRKMQKTIYRVRTLAHIVERIALDLLRDGCAYSGPAVASPRLRGAAGAVLGPVVMIQSQLLVIFLSVGKGFG